MKKVVITEELVKTWRYLHRERDWSPKKPYCKLCSHLDTRHRWLSRFSYFKVGEEVYKVTYMNGHVGYYHVACIDNPRNQMRIENILRYDVDRWTDLEPFLKQLRAEPLTDSQRVTEIRERFKCSRATAYRKLKAF